MTQRRDHRDAPSRADGGRRRGALVAWLAAGVLSAAGTPAGGGVQPGAAAWAGDAAVLNDAAATPAARVTAAKRLLASADPAARQGVLDALRTTGEPTETRDALLAALVQGPAPEWAMPGILAAFENAPAERQGEWLACLGTIRTRESLRTLLRFAEPSQAPGIREAAIAAAIRLSGQFQLRSDVAKWNEWFAGVEWLPEPEWRRTLSDGITQYALQLETQRDAVLRRLIDSERRRFIEAPSEADRWNILAAQLKDELPAMRRLGVELTNRELANARLPAGAVPQAALGLLNDPWPDLRVAGANLAERLQPANAGASIAQALLVENDPSVLGPLLRLAARWPSAEIRGRLIECLSPASPVQGEALRTLDAMEKAGHLASAEDRAKVLEAVRNLPPVKVTAASQRLRCVLGDASDRAAVGQMLDDADPAKRLSAAQAVSSFEEWLDPVVAAAREDDGLFGVAAGMIARYRPNADGFRLLLSLPSASSAGPGQRDPGREAILSLADKLAPGELLAMSSTVFDAELRESILSRFATMPIGPISFPVVRASDVQSLVAAAGLLSLAQTRIELHKPAAALAAIDRIETTGVPIAPEVVTSLKAQALLGVNRIADAIELDAPVSAWIIALAEIIDLPHAPSVLRVLDANFAGLFTPSEQGTLDALRLMVRERHPEGTLTPDSSRPKRGGPRLPPR